MNMVPACFGSLCVVLLLVIAGYALGRGEAHVM